jgi:hypothetical protein
LFKDWLPWTDKPSISPSVLPSGSPSKSPSVFPGLDAGASVDQTPPTKPTANVYEAQSLPDPTGLSNTRQGISSTDTMQENSSASDSGRSPSMLEAMMTIIRPASMSSGINESVSAPETQESAQNGGGIFDVFRQPGHRRKLRGDMSESEINNGEKTHYS